MAPAPALAPGALAISASVVSVIRAPNASPPAEPGRKSTALSNHVEPGRSNTTTAPVLAPSAQALGAPTASCAPTTVTAAPKPLDAAEQPATDPVMVSVPHRMGSMVIG